MVPEQAKKCLPNHSSVSLSFMGYEIRPFKILKNLKSGHFEGRISNGPSFNCLGFSYVPTIQKPDNSKSGRFCPNLKLVLIKRWPFVLLGFWISDPIRNPDHLLPQKSFLIALCVRTEFYNYSRVPNNGCLINQFI